MDLIPFGKYKGQRIEVLQNDQQYCDWLMSQEWFRERYSQINTIIVNNFQEPSETPEHNKIQARFLDEDYCLRVINYCKAKYNEPYSDRILTSVKERVFEEEGFDIKIKFSYKYKELLQEENGVYLPIYFEIKPIIGDDYPAILRQIKSNKKLSYEKRILCYDYYQAEGATEEQFNEMFLMDKILTVNLKKV